MKLTKRIEDFNPAIYFQLLILRSKLSTLTRGALVRRYLKSTAYPKLQIGAGRNYIDGWLNTDFLAKHPKFIFVDVTKPFPLPSNTFERIFSEHMIEHIPLQGAETMLAESFRVLKPGGRIRLETPDLRKICGLYSTYQQPDAASFIQWQNDNFGKKGRPPTLCFAINNILRNWNHLFVFDDQMLALLMAEAGFQDITQHGWGQSEDAQFQNNSGRGSVPTTVFETLCLEGTKPG